MRAQLPTYRTYAIDHKDCVRHFQRQTAENEVVKKQENTLAETTQTDVVGEQRNSESIFTFMLLAFLGGLAAILTPCVFPMIPMTVSFFTNRTGKASAITYGISIILIYTIVFFFNNSIANSLSLILRNCIQQFLKFGRKS